MWTRRLPVQLGPRRLRPRRPNALERRKATEIADLLEARRAQIGTLSERDLLMAGVALYAGEGSKAGERVAFTNADTAMIALLCAWLRCFFEIVSVGCGYRSISTKGSTFVPLSCSHQR